MPVTSSTFRARTPPILPVFVGDQRIVDGKNLRDMR